MIQDAQGHYLSGATAEAVAAFDQAVRAFNLVHGDAVGLFDAAREAAPDFAMAHMGKAWVFAIANDPGLMTQARALVETTQPLPLNEREQAHLAALSHVVEGGGADGRLSRALPLGTGPLGAGPAVVAQGPARLCDPIGLACLRG